MTAETFALYCRRIRLADSPPELARIRAELDREHGNEPDSWPLRFMATAKRVRLEEAD